MNRSLVQYREAVAVELAVEGRTFVEIAEIVGYSSRSGAWRAVRRSLQRRTDKAVDAYRTKALIDLELVQERAWPAAMSGDIKASEVVVRVIEERCRLLGV